MDQITSVVAAVDAGKLPTQQQISHAIDLFLDSAVSQVEPASDEHPLSDQGRIIAEGIRSLLGAYKELGASKNSDNKLQEALWHLSEAEISQASVDTPASAGNSAEARRDAQAIQSALRTILDVSWTNLSSQTSSLSVDFASFLRLALADAAGFVEAQAGSAKEGLRSVEEGVQSGDRDALGRKKLSEEEKERRQDPKVLWESSMDTVKDAGTTVIATSQSASESVSETYERTTTRLQSAYAQVCERAQKDPQYRESISTLFDLAEKWLTRSADVTESTKDASLESFINDPTPDQHLIHAIRDLRALTERLAGEKSLSDFFARLRDVALDVREDQDVNTWFKSFFAHVRKSLQDPDYSGSEESKRKFSELRTEWRQLLQSDTEKGKKWKSDVTALRREIRDYRAAIDEDRDLQRVREAHKVFADKLESGVIGTAEQGAKIALNQAAWFWQDLFRVYTPRLLASLKDIPIPRTEYTDNEVELVLENVDVSSFNVLPSHVYIRNITDIDVTAPASAAAATKTEVGTLTHIRVQALQLKLEDISFYYKDKTATVGPSEFTGLLAFTLPPQGIDVDLRVRMIPNSEAGLQRREKLGGYLEIDDVAVKVAEGVELDVRDSNHSVLLTMFKPIVTLRMRDALERALTEQIRSLLHWTDAVAYDVGKRSEVFADTGLPLGASYTAAVWSEIGRLTRSPRGSWQATGTGLIRESESAKFAMGIEPQILSGEKSGPQATFSKPLPEQLGVDADAMSIDTNEAATETSQLAATVGNKVAGAVQAASNKVKSFKQTVQAKAEQEKSRSGWQSSAYDLKF